MEIDVLRDDNTRANFRDVYYGKMKIFTTYLPVSNYDATVAFAFLSRSVQIHVLRGDTSRASSRDMYY